MHQASLWIREETHRAWIDISSRDFSKDPERENFMPLSIDMYMTKVDSS